MFSQAFGGVNVCRGVTKWFLCCKKFSFLRSRDSTFSTDKPVLAFAQRNLADIIWWARSTFLYKWICCKNTSTGNCTTSQEIYDETSAPGIGMKTRTRICGNGWVVQRRTGVYTHVPKQKVAGGDEHFRHKQASHISNTHIHTIAHKISSPDYLRQRWTVSDPFKGYDDAAHFWYTPEHVPVCWRNIHIFFDTSYVKTFA